MKIEVIYQGILALLSMFEIWMYYQLVYEVLVDKQKLSRSKKCIIWISIGTIGILLSVNRNFLFFSDALFWIMLIVIVLLTWLITRERLVLNIGISIIYYSFVALLDFLFVFLSIVFLGQGFSERVYLRGISLEKLIVYTCARVMVLLIVWTIKKSDITKDILEYQMIFCVVGVIFCVLIQQYQLVLVKMLNGIGEFRIWENIISLMNAIILISMMGIFWMKNKIMQKENAFLLFQEKLAQQKYKELESALEKNRELVHDTKNHYLVIQEYAESNEHEKLHQYVSELCEEFIKSNAYIYTGNRIIDLILGQKQNLAEQEQIKYEVQSTPLSHINIKEQELCTLFGNLLDNAIEACRQVTLGGKEISVRIEQQKKMLFIEIENTFEKMPKRKNGFFISTKNEMDIHGYGLKSVERIVEAYEGDISYEIKENKFAVNISFFYME